MSNTPTVWAGLRPQGGFGLSGQRLPDLPATTVAYGAVDSLGTRHILVRIPDSFQPDVRPFRTRALDVKVEQLSVSGLPEERFLVLACRDSGFHALFDRLLGDLAESLGRGSLSPGEVGIQTIERWRRFWTVDPDQLSEERALGLMGELWFLVRWIRILDRAALLGWTGPLGGNHDFQWKKISVEVKATAKRQSPVRHRISSLEQLAAPDTGVLFVFSMQFLDDVLAANSLASMVQTARVAVDGDVVLQELLAERLAAAGYTPAAETRLSRTYRLLSEELYSVQPGFPRLTREVFGGGLPVGVGGVTYEISMEACAPFLVATSEDEARTLLSVRE